MDLNKLWKILQEMEVSELPTHFLKTCMQEATVRAGHGTTDWFHIGNGVYQVCMFSHCLLNLNAWKVMCNARLGGAQAGIKIAGKISTTSEIQVIPF